MLNLPSMCVVGMCVEGMCVVGMCMVVTHTWHPNKKYCYEKNIVILIQLQFLSIAKKNLKTCNQVGIGYAEDA